MTNGDGQVVMDQDYMLFGADLARVDQLEVQNDIDMTYKYTGQSEVASIGLYYYKARYYDQSIGRFITEDTWKGRLAEPQTQNTYIYTLNNPLKYIDPTGNTPAGTGVLEYPTIIDLKALWAMISDAGIAIG